MLIVTERETLPVAKARSGDSASWDALFKRYQLPLYVYVAELVRNEQTSLDIVQETFISAVRHIGSLRDDEKFGSWLFGIAHQKCLQHWRQNQRDAALFDDRAELALGDVDAPFEMLVRAEQEVELMRFLHQLPPPQRSVLLLHFIDEFSLEEIAVITETPLGTVKSRVHYAKRALRELLEAQP
jgi:RNA polymerase sigma-70 factor (ECF subfamily)